MTKVIFTNMLGETLWEEDWNEGATTTENIQLYIKEKNLILEDVVDYDNGYVVVILMSTIRFKCPKCGCTDLVSESLELVKFKHHIVNDNFISEKRINLEHESWTLFCTNKGCKNTEGFPESELDD